MKMASATKVSMPKKSKSSGSKQGGKEEKEQAQEQAQKIIDAAAAKQTKKASGKQKLLDLGLTEEEVNALIGN